MPETSRSFRLGVAGPVGTGKTSLIALLCTALADRFEIGVVTNDIYTDEDAQFLRSAGVLDPARIRAVETGACPHTAIRDDVTANLLAIEDLEDDYAALDLVLVESGGDNLTATFSPALVDAQIFVLDVAGGGDVARKGGPGIARADLLVLNKTDLAPYVGVDLPRMLADATNARDGRPVVCLSRHDPASIDQLTSWVTQMTARVRDGQHVPVDPGPMAPHNHRTTTATTTATSTATATRTGRPMTTTMTTRPVIRVMTTRIEVGRDDGGRLRCDLTPGALAPRLIHRDQHTVRVGLVATMALLLAGDDVVIDVHVGPGVALEIIETGGTVAYDMRGGSASWRVTATVEQGSALVWSGLPLVVSGGAVVARVTELHLAADALALLRETFVLGRAEEYGGDLRSTTSVLRDGIPELREDLDLTVGRREDFGVLGSYRCLDTMTMLGSRLEDGPGVLQLAGEGSIARSMTHELHESRLHLGYRQAAEATIQRIAPSLGR